MRNYLLLISLFVSLGMTTLELIPKELDFYVYYIESKNIVVCSDKKEGKQGPVLNEFENGKGYTCLLKLKEKMPFYKINFHLSKLEKSLYYDSHELDLNLGESEIFKNVSNFPTTKQIFIQFDSKNKIVSYLSNKNCNLEYLESCQFQESKDSLFLNDFLKINISFRKRQYSLNLIEKNSAISIYL